MATHLKPETKSRASRDGKKTLAPRAAKASPVQPKAARRVASKAEGGEGQTSAPAAGDRVLYLYAITQASTEPEPKLAAEAIDGVAEVEAISSQGYVCWISRVSRREFADEISDRMQDLEWLAAAGLRHQRIVAEIASHKAALPARFGTAFLTEYSMLQHVKQRQDAIRHAFARVTNADEWGIKIFAVARPRPGSAAKATSGADYLKRKAETLHPRVKTSDEDITRLVEELAVLSVDTSPGGKASAGQPGLLWHGSFLVKQKNRRKFEATLKRYAETWAGVRRIDCSGPWPPYSFVGDHAG